MAGPKNPRDAARRRAGQNQVPGWAAKYDKPGSALNPIFIVFLAIAIFAGAVYLLTLNHPFDQPIAAPPPPPAAQQAPKIIPIPADEQRFAAAVVEAALTYNTPSASAAQTTFRTHFRQAVCDALGTPHVSQWVGIVKTLSNGANQTILAITLDTQLSHPTGNAILTPPITVLASAPLIPASNGMNPGDTVTFSGNFLPAPASLGCSRQDSPAITQFMENPAFLMQFSDVKEAQ